MQITLPTSKKFAEDKGEELSAGVWSNLESILLKEIIKASKINESIIPHKLYNDIVCYANSNFCTVTTHVHELTVLRKKTNAQIQSKLTLIVDS